MTTKAILEEDPLGIKLAGRARTERREKFECGRAKTESKRKLSAASAAKLSWRKN